jgi:N-alpha-acetyltransferase 30
VHYAGYTGERQLGAIMALVDRDLSEPYSIFTYRYFLSGWPHLCVLVRPVYVYCL